AAADLSDHRLVGLHVAHVALAVDWRGMAGGGDLLNERRRGGIVDVDEGDLRSLLGEILDDRGADARAAAGDEDDAVAKAGIGSEARHGISLEVGETERGFAGQRRAGLETGRTDFARDMAHRFDAKIRLARRYVDDDVAERHRRCHLET